MALEFSDAFVEGSNTPIASHTPSFPLVGASWSQATNGSPNARVLAANDTLQADANQASRHLFAIASPAPSIADYDVQFKVAAQPGSGSDDTIALVARYADMANYYGVVIYRHSVSGSLNFQAFKRITSGVTGLGSDTDDAHALAPGDIFILSVRTVGSNVEVKVYQNGNLRISGTDTSNTITAIGSAGVGWGDLYDVNDDIVMGFEVDDFSFTTVDAAGQPTMKRWGGVPHMEPRGRGVW